MEKRWTWGGFTALAMALVLYWQPWQAELSLALPWPTEEPPGGYDLAAIDGQLLDLGGSQWKLHHGIDIPAPPGTPVFAIETGVVARVDYDPEYPNDHYAGVAVASLGSTDRGFVYYHLQNILVEETQEVEAGQQLGEVIAWPDTGTYDHLHLQWASPATVTTSGDGIPDWDGDFLTAGNTLRRLAASADAVDPVIVDIIDADRPFVLLDSTNQELTPGQTASGRIKVLARIEDRFREGSNWVLPPYAFSVGLRAPGSEIWMLAERGMAFDGELPTGPAVADVIYHRGGGYASRGGITGAREFYIHVAHTDGNGVFDLTDGQAALDLTGVSPGQYELWVTASDAAGRQAERSMTITVGGS